MVSSWKFFLRGICRLVGIHFRTRSEKRQYSEVIVALEEMRIGYIQSLVIFGKERRILDFQFSEEKMDVADGSVQTSPVIIGHARGVEFAVSRCLSGVFRPGVRSDEFIRRPLIVGEGYRVCHMDRLVVSVCPVLDGGFVFHGIRQVGSLCRSDIEKVA